MTNHKGNKQLVDKKKSKGKKGWGVMRKRLLIMLERERMKRIRSIFLAIFARMNT
jgi:hypothetical protein